MQPVLISDVVTVAASSTENNVIATNDSLRAVLRAPFPAQIQLFVTVSDLDLEFSFDAGGENFVDLSNARVTAAGELNQLDLISDDIYVDEGAQLELRAINGDLAAQTITYRIVLTPLGEPGQRVQMPISARTTQRGPVAIANGSIDAQQLDGRRYERVQSPHTGRLYMNQSAAGAMTFQQYIGQERIIPPSRFNIQNRIPIEPDDETVTDIEIAPDRLIQLMVSNQTGGALNIFWRWIVTPSEG